ncbi:hypothetical protein D3C73_874440 [compost metagenome]
MIEFNQLIGILLEVLGQLLANRLTIRLRSWQLHGKYVQLSNGLVCIEMHIQDSLAVMPFLLIDIIYSIQGIQRLIPDKNIEKWMIDAQLSFLIIYPLIDMPIVFFSKCS